MSSELEDLATLLSDTKVIGEGVSFVGESLRLDDAEDAQVVTDAIAACKNMDSLNLEGNTLGVEAAKAIGLALEKHPELKRALWKDMFTGRSKDEIPQALRYLGSGLDIANVRLVELDLSDNAFGPIGMEGLASLLRSSSCYSLQELRLNNNGLGITGSKLLSKSLMDCYENSKAAGKALPLRVFIAGRNRLENEGIKALSNVFKVIGSLEEIQIPQNGIYHTGIRSLSEALKCNPGLRVLNLNDNTVGPKGSAHLATALPCLQLLTCLNLGDCLIKTSGSLSLAAALEPRHFALEELILDQNEIKVTGGLAIVKAVENKKKLKTLSLNFNQFGEEGINAIKDAFQKHHRSEVLESLSDDEGDDDDDYNDEDDNSDEDQENDSEQSGEDNSGSENGEVDSVREQSFGSQITSVENAMMNLLKQVTAADFLEFPSPERFLALKLNRAQQILSEVKLKDNTVEGLLVAVMKVSSLAEVEEVGVPALECSTALYRELFSLAQQRNHLSLLNNSILVHLGLIKSEDKKWKPQYNLAGCKKALSLAMTQNFFPQSSKDTMLCFLKKKQESIDTITIS